MALIFRLHQNRQLLKYVAANKSLILLARPVTIKAQPAPPQSCEGYDERNMKIGRPLSPHLLIYKPQLTAMLSITHRATGMALGFYLVCLSVGTMLTSHDLMYYMSSLENISWFTHFIGKMCFAVPLAYHYVNGIRHLAWDMGKLLTIKEVYSSGYAMLGISIIAAGVLAML
ncbi:uncharacterized protein [Onthophagus taurus]|uniref:uncharacterized protein n=1 Tax=Onthophagus taurus TaxID=166361 RepID=UPI000C20F940|nr:uncharacterized protein LOC111429075 [Onthophagus taurus]